jgi:hypothetical protein
VWYGVCVCVCVCACVCVCVGVWEGRGGRGGGGGIERDRYRDSNKTTGAPAQWRIRNTVTAFGPTGIFSASYDVLGGGLQDVLPHGLVSGTLAQYNSSVAVAGPPWQVPLCVQRVYYDSVHI